ncbi:MAG: hypothetical protein KJO66_05525, partial [Gammaproteobacteria bacterium]|nr:hypothetical protein [Gammaproteobacteria bacterium]
FMRDAGFGLRAGVVQAPQDNLALFAVYVFFKNGLFAEQAPVKTVVVGARLLPDGLCAETEFFTERGLYGIRIELVRDKVISPHFDGYLIFLLSVSGSWMAIPVSLENPYTGCLQLILRPGSGTRQPVYINS